MEKDIVKKNGFIEESLYQRIKIKMNKTDDWFSQEELKNLQIFTEKSDVILT